MSTLLRANLEMFLHFHTLSGEEEEEEEEEEEDFTQMQRVIRCE